MAMHVRTRTLAAAAAAGLALTALTGCDSASTSTGASTSTRPSAATPTLSSAAEAKLNQDVSDLILLRDYQDVAHAMVEVAEDGEAASSQADLTDVGSAMVRAAREGLALEDIPGVGAVANQAWDDAMNDYLLAGGYLQVPMLGLASDALQSATAHLNVAAAAM